MKPRLIVATLVLAVLGAAPSASGAPFLQLDASGGWYNYTTQSIATNQRTFDLYILVGSLTLPENLFYSVALLPQTSSDANLGSIVVNGTTVAVTAGMVYGVPPTESFIQTRDPNDLATHGMFPTYFQQFAAPTSGWFRAASYDAEAAPGGPTASATGSMLAVAIPIDLSGLEAGYGIHFDLYTTKPGRQAPTDTDIDRFAPFSHDVDATPTPVPEPATMLLLGSGLLGAGFLMRRRRS